MKKLVLFIFLLSASNITNAKLLDKIQAVFNDQVITLSQVQRVRNSLGARRNIIPQIYTKSKMSDQEIVEKKIQQFVIRQKLETIGLIVTDKEVEDSIADREEKLGVTRQELIKFLDQNNLTFDEYFELTREAIEHQKFLAWVIRPLISVTDQEIKNYYYKNNKNKKTISFSYNIVGFSIERSAVKNTNQFRQDLISFQQNGVLPEYLANLQTNPFGQISEDGLTKQIRKSLENVNENEFTQPIRIGGDYHIFFVKEKKLKESADFLRQKDRIQNVLAGKQVINISQNWFNSEKNKYYIKYFFNK